MHGIHTSSYSQTVDSCATVRTLLEFDVNGTECRQDRQLFHDKYQHHELWLEFRPRQSKIRATKRKRKKPWAFHCSQDRRCCPCKKKRSCCQINVDSEFLKCDRSRNELIGKLLAIRKLSLIRILIEAPSCRDSIGLDYVIVFSF